MTEMLNKIKELVEAKKSFRIHVEYADRYVGYIFYAPDSDEDLWCVSIIRDDASEHRPCIIDVCESAQALILADVINDSRLVQIIGGDGLTTGTMYIYIHPIDEHNGVLKRTLSILEPDIFSWKEILCESNSNDE